LTDVGDVNKVEGNEMPIEEKYSFAGRFSTEGIVGRHRKTSDPKV
jgi:hypothetical protein